MTEEIKAFPEVLRFVRGRDYDFVKLLGAGACGQTVLLRDPTIDEHFVCKKYTPYSESARATLFQGFIREIKLLHQVHHENVVRVFNHYLYPDVYAGFILMEYVEGQTVDAFIKARPQSLNDVFEQTVSGFTYLEGCKILHRDIRPQNLMVRKDGRVKIIDLGFGKLVDTPTDFDKSISLNWWCEVPDEFKRSTYTYATEVYFVGKMFERLMHENDIKHFGYGNVIERMINRDPLNRYSSFQEVQRQMESSRTAFLAFTEGETRAYRRFSAALKSKLDSLNSNATFVNDPLKILTQLTERYQNFMLEEQVPDSSSVIGCFVDGGYRYFTDGLAVDIVKDFLELLRGSGNDKRTVILANLQTVLSTVGRHQPEEEDIPF